MAELDDVRADRRVRTFCLLALTLIASGFALYALKPVLVPFVLAVFFTYCLKPIIDLQTRYLRVPHGVAIIGTAVLGVLLLLIIGLVVATTIGTMSHEFDAYQEQMHRLAGQIARAVPLERLGIKPDPETGRVFRIPEDAGASFVSAVLSETTNIISNGVVVVIFMLFILLGDKAVGARRAGLLVEIEMQVKRYISQTVLFSFVTGAMVAAVLAVLGVRFAGVFGFLAFLLNFIPNIGSIVATLLPLPVILLSPQMSSTAKILALAIPAAIQFLIGNFIQPKVQGSALQLHPVAVLMSLIFFGMIWGMVGAFLATPIAAVIRIIFERIPATRPLADLLAGNLGGVPAVGDTAAGVPR
jgi:AI-2 transport protein TqsA